MAQTLDAIPRTDSVSGQTFWYINPPKKKKKAGRNPKGKVPAHLRPYLFKKGHSNPFTHLHYPKRKQTTVEFRDSANGKFKKVAGKKPPRMSNPPYLAVMNPRGSHGRNAPGSMKGGFGGFFSSLMSLRGAAHIGTGIGAAAVDRQLVPRGMAMLPAWANWFKQGIGYYIARVLALLIPSAVIYRFASKSYGLAYAAGGATSIGLSALETGLNKAGVPTMGEMAGEVAEVEGNPLGWFAGYRAAGSTPQPEPANMRGYRPRLGFGGYGQRGPATGLNEAGDSLTEADLQQQGATEGM